MVVWHTSRFLKLVTALLLVLIAGLMVWAFLFFNAMLEGAKTQGAILGHLEHMMLADKAIDRIFDKTIGYLNYDEISAAIRTFEQELKALQSKIARAAPFEDAPQVQNMLETLGQQLAKKSRTAERYKSGNAVINNSLYYLFDLHEKLEMRILKRHDPETCEPILTKLNHILSILYISSRSAYQNTGELATVLDALKHEKSIIQPDIDTEDFLHLYILHVEKILEYSNVIAAGLALQKERSITQQLDALRQEIEARYGALVGEQIRMSYVMFGLTLVIFGAFVFVYREDLRLKKRLHALNSELIEANGELQRRYDELANSKMVQKIQEEMLIQQSKMAAMGEMIGVIAHQWKQPLGALSLSIDLLEELYEEDGLDVQEMEGIVDNTRKQIHFMATTIDDFRDFFKPSRHVASFDLEGAVRGVCKILQPQFDRAQIDVTLQASAQCIVSGYENELKQVILNLLANAKDAIISKTAALAEKAGFKGVIRITLETQEKMACVRIEDNGGGIPESIASSIFDPYFTTKGENGTGIGLYVSKTIVEEKGGGTLQFFNTSEGATFVVCMPAASSSADTPKS